MADGMQKPLTGEKPSGLELLREPFPEHQISKLPKETRAQIDERKKDRGVILWNCPKCGGHHHRNAVHLDYVGHAALTDRLLSADPHWTWEPVVIDGLPNPGQGMWIRLTVCGVSRLGYGSADGKTGGDAIKEIIGDALRNAAMRFGAALDLWHKGDLHALEDAPETADSKAFEQPPKAKGAQRLAKKDARELSRKLADGMRKQTSIAGIQGWLEAFDNELKSLPEDWERLLREEAQQEIEAHEALDDEIEGPGF